jgi:hypothetical protein
MSSTKLIVVFYFLLAYLSWTADSEHWKSRRMKITGGYKFQIKNGDGNLATYGEVMDRLKERDIKLISLIKHNILETGFEAVFWETVPISYSKLSSPFEFVVLDAPPLAQKRADPTAFAMQFQAFSSQSVISFVNLGNDAVLVVPCPTKVSSQGNLQHYTHLASFLREANEPQRIDLWGKIGEAMYERLKAQPQTPIWLSTSGLGVSWLHIRIDNTPKYYNYESYKDWSFYQLKSEQ